MLSDTLTTELERYQIGARIKKLRLRKVLSLQQLSDHTGLSVAMLSKIERGSLFPTLPTLLRIALVFGVQLDHFFVSTEPRIAVTRKDERIKLPIPASGEPTSYLFESLDYPLADRRIEAYLAHFPAGGPASEPHQHGVEELVYMMEGSLIVTVDGQETVLATGDAMSFDSGLPHSYRPQGPASCEALVVTVE
jgi:transcriptional regulator with XRE-family HTH domain